MHKGRCGARVTLRADGTAELQYPEKTKTKLPQGSNGPDISHALVEMRPRMKGCESTLWMLAGEKDAKWGSAFDVGMAVSALEAEGNVRYIMLL
jgi:hypothetical protein